VAIRQFFRTSSFIFTAVIVVGLVAIMEVTDLSISYVVTVRGINGLILVMRLWLQIILFNQLWMVKS